MTVTLPADTGARRFVGPADLKPAGRQVGATDFAVTAIEGPDAHDAAAAGQPVQIGGVAESTTPSAVADGDAVRAFFDLLGQLAVRIRSSTGTSVFPDPAALADNTANPTLSQIAAFLMLFDGSTWDRAPGDATNGLKVQIPSALPAGTNAIGKLAANSGVDIGDVDVTSLPYTAALTMTHGTASATTSSGSSNALASNASRRYALIQNIGSVDVFIKIGADAVASEGICLKASGGYYEMSQAFGNLATGNIRAITASSSATLLTSEGV